MGLVPDKFEVSLSEKDRQVLLRVIALLEDLTNRDVKISFEKKT